MLRGFKEFVLRGNVLDLAVAVMDRSPVRPAEIADQLLDGVRDAV